MKKTITEYLSKYGIQFHHTITSFKKAEKKRPSSEFLPETHYLCELFLLLSGNVTYNIEGQTYHFSPHDAIFILPNKLHSLEFDVTKPYERMVLHFSPNLVAAFPALKLFSSQFDYAMPTVIPKQITEKYKLPELMFNIKKVCDSKHTYIDLHISTAILQIVEALDSILSELSESNTLTPIKIDRISHTCIKFINENLTNKAILTPQNLAQELHISLSHLQHTFKKEMGVSLHCYIANQRMQLAKKMLLQGILPQDVSNMLGYDYYSTFYHNFQKYFRASPTSYAKIEETLFEDFKRTQINGNLKDKD